jgi:hypothetical protein
MDFVIKGLVDFVNVNIEDRICSPNIPNQLSDLRYISVVTSEVWIFYEPTDPRKTRAGSDMYTRRSNQ